jgi:GNAT superfamily N-acetyltransferase
VSTRLDIVIRPLRQEELNTLQRFLPRPAGIHLERWEAQQRGEVVYLVAWLMDVPVGHLLLVWGGHVGEPAEILLEPCPSLSDIAVAPAYQSGGIGSRLMEEAEELAGRQGYARVGLGVALDNSRARRLYERRGYIDPGLGYYTIRYVALDGAGRERLHEEVCVYLVKDLTSDVETMGEEKT